MSAETPVRVLLLPMPVMLRLGVRAMLAEHRPRVAIVAPDAVHPADVALLDPLAPDVEQIVDRLDVPWVGLSWDTTPATARRARDLGAVAVLPTTITTGKLVRALEHAAQAEPRDPTPAPAAGPSADDVASPLPLLSHREGQILGRIALGWSNHEIADDLYLSVNSIKTYVRQCYRKIGVTRRAQAVVWAKDRGLGGEP